MAEDSGCAIQCRSMGNFFSRLNQGRIDLIFPHEDEIAQNCVACRRVMLATGCIMVLLTKW
ncbi:hypothetical protein RDI58_003577 [Solanum bulbocastanum]|uniref:Uncharacterized protein n=1 Tax=Solanum bulbocastanum TaxID=147425 RepID=A0AAN8U612_SOLBU